MPADSVTVAPEQFELDPARDIRNVHGAPSWLELVTPDPDRAAEVLGNVLGWEFEPLDDSETGMFYLVGRVAGHDVGGVRRPMPNEPQSPRWITYVTVADVDEIASSAGDAGATVVVPPMPLGTVGRMTVIDSPETAQVYAFQYNRRFA
jgi:predicted enzyme related to lactoylglutathione lyase